MVFLRLEGEGCAGIVLLVDKAEADGERMDDDAELEGVEEEVVGLEEDRRRAGCTLGTVDEEEEEEVGEGTLRWVDGVAALLISDQPQRRWCRSVTSRAMKGIVMAAAASDS